MIEEPEILIERQGCAGLVTLNRSRALNALTVNMVRKLAQALDEWEHDPAITRIIVQGAGEKAFCAGGDIRQLYELGRAGRQDEAVPFWREEYILNARINSYPKPYIALIDGIVMGGGVGVSMHGSHRVASEKLLFAMPEVSIGFFPDIGASYLLSRLPGCYGTFLAMSGERLQQADALALGLATAAVLSSQMDALRAALIAGGDVDVVIASFAIPLPSGPVVAERAVIDRCFSANTPLEVLAQLDVEALAGSAFAIKLAATIRGKSPMSVAIAHEQVKRGASMSFAEVMQMEFRIVCRVCHGHDFYEGVRAVLIDKDNAPRWLPSSLEALDLNAVAEHFAPLGADELSLEA